ncbi:MAG: hypothetical protein ABI604_09415, partial [Nitrospirota bacterium]
AIRQAPLQEWSQLSNQPEPPLITFLKNMSKLLRLAGVDVLDLQSMELAGELIFFPLGGSSLALWTFRLEPLSRPEFHLFDRDNQPPLAALHQPEVDAINLRERCTAFITGRKEMENYLHFEAINEAYARLSISLALSGNFGDFDDVPASVAQKVHTIGSTQNLWVELDDNTRKRKISQAKVHLNDLAVSLMTKARLDQVDPGGDVLNWFAQMKKLTNV